MTTSAERRQFVMDVLQREMDRTDAVQDEAIRRARIDSYGPKWQREELGQLRMGILSSLTTAFVEASDAMRGNRIVIRTTLKNAVRQAFPDMHEAVAEWEAKKFLKAVPDGLKHYQAV